MSLYGLDGLPIGTDEATRLWADVAARLIGETIIETSNGKMRVVTFHTVVDQTPYAGQAVEHVPVLYLTAITHRGGVCGARPQVVARYTSRVVAGIGHASRVAEEVATAPGRVLEIREVTPVALR